VQWVEDPRKDAPATLRTIADLPLASEVWYNKVELLNRNGRWQARLRGPAAARITFDLGPPGQVTKLDVW
jgi:hypothetical protein